MKSLLLAKFHFYCLSRVFRLKKHATFLPDKVGTDTKQPMFGNVFPGATRFGPVALFAVELSTAVALNILASGGMTYYDKAAAAELRVKNMLVRSLPSVLPHLGRHFRVAAPQHQHASRPSPSDVKVKVYRQSRVTEEPVVALSVL